MTDQYTKPRTIFTLLTGSYKVMRRATPNQPTTLAAGLWRAALICFGLGIVGPTIFRALGSAPSGVFVFIAIVAALRLWRRRRSRRR
jgi:hypothetical protein